MQFKSKLWLTFCLATCFSLSAMADEVKTLTYQLISEKKDIGEITQTYISNKNKLFVLTQSRLKWSSWLESLDIEESSIEEYENLKLIRSEAYTIDYDEEVFYNSSFQKNKTDYLVLLSEKKKLSKDEIQRFKNYKKEVASTQKLKQFSTFPMETKELYRSTIALDSFDSTQNIVTFSLKNRAIEKKLNILSFDELSIDETEVSNLGTEELTINKNLFLTQHFKLKPKGKKSTDIWISNENSTMPYIVRVKGSDESGAFELILKTIKGA